MYALVLICCSSCNCVKFEHHDSRLIQITSFASLQIYFCGFEEGGEIWNNEQDFFKC